MMENMTSKQLKEMAKNLKVKNWWKLSKADLIKGIEEVQDKKQYKERCDECGQADVLQEYEGKLLCNECVEKHIEETGEHVEEVEEIEECEEPQEVEERKLVPMPGIEKLEELRKVYEPKKKKAKIATAYRSNADLGKDFMYALVIPNEYDIKEFLELTNKYLEANDWPKGELVVEDAEEIFEVAFAKVKGQSKQQWHAICKAFTQAKKDIIK